MKGWLLYLIAFPCIAFSQELPPQKNPAHVDLTKAYGFLLGQANTLNLIEKRYPELSGDVLQARARFRLAFGGSIENVQANLEKLLGDNWAPLELELKKRMSNLAAGKMTTESARGFIDEVTKRSKGVMEESVVQTLLAYTPQFEKSPADEFTRGFKQTFRSKGHEKSAGLDLQFEFPRSWTAQDGLHSHIVKNALANQGRGPTSAMLMITPVPESEVISVKDIDEMFTANGIRDLAPNDAKIMSVNPTKIEGLKAGILIYEIEMERAGARVWMKTYQLATFFNRSLIVVSCSVAQREEDRDALEKEFSKFEPLFRLITSSLVIHDKWKK